jgi:hypothetical protein
MKTIIVSLCVSALFFMSPHTHGHQAAERSNPSSVNSDSSRMSDSAGEIITVSGYPTIIARYEDGIEVKCAVNAMYICYTVNTTTNTGCIDPFGCNPEVGPTFFGAREVNGSYYEVVGSGDDYVTYLVYIVPGSVRRGG